MNEEYCSHCNPELFVLYGYCMNCGKRCHIPLFDPKKPMGAMITKEEWEEYPEFLSYEQLQGIKNGTLNFIAKPVKDEFHLPYNPL